MPAIFYRAPPPPKSKPGPGVITVKPHHPWHCRMMVGLTLITTTGLGIFLYQNSLQVLGNQQQVLAKKNILEQESYRQQMEQLQLQNVSLSQHNQELRNKLTDVVRTTQHSQSAYAETLDFLKQTLEENREIKEELSYYKELLKAYPTLSEPKLIPQFTLYYDEINDRYLYHLVLIHWTREAQMSGGRLQFKVLGHNTQGIKKELTMKQIMTDAPDAITYNVLYFQRIKNYLQIPDHFIPQQIVVELWKGSQEEPRQQTFFEWNEVLKRGQL